MHAPASLWALACATRHCAPRLEAQLPAAPAVPAAAWSAVAQACIIQRVRAEEAAGRRVSGQATSIASGNASAQGQS